MFETSQCFVLQCPRCKCDIVLPRRSPLGNYAGREYRFHEYYDAGSLLKHELRVRPAEFVCIDCRHIFDLGSKAEIKAGAEYENSRARFQSHCLWQFAIRTKHYAEKKLYTVALCALEDQDLIKTITAIRAEWRNAIDEVNGANFLRSPDNSETIVLIHKFPLFAS